MVTMIREYASPGSGWVNNNGYRMVPTETGPRLEHRLVMEAILGRPLWGDENVHHKDGNRLNNDPDNLELWSTKQPKGQRVAEKVPWALEILARYAPELLRDGVIGAVA